MKFNKQNVKKNSLRIGTGVLAFAAGLAATFFLVPNRVNFIKFDDPEPEEIEETYFSRFVSRITPLISGESDEESEDTVEAFGLKADLYEVEINWPNNKIVVGGQINVNIKNIKDLDLTLDLDVNYNGKNIDLGLGYVDSTLYVACKDLKLKTCFVNDKVANKQFVDMFKKIGTLFFDTENEDGMKIDFQIGEILGGLLGGLDLGSLGSGLAFTVNETEDETYAYSTISLGIDENTNIDILLTIGKETLSLESVNVSPIKIGDVEIKAKLNCETRPDLPVYALDSENYTYKQRGKFVETFNYTSWIDSIFNLLKTRTVGLDISASLVDANKSYGVVDATIDLDASRFEPLDLVGMVIGPELFGISVVEEEEEPVEKSFMRSTSAVSGGSVLDTINNFDFNVGLKLANMKKQDDGSLKRVDYSNLDVAYFKDGDGINAGYLTLNEENGNAVMKAKVDVSTINFLIDEIPELIDSLSPENPDVEEDEDGLFDFITSSDLINAIHDGQYDAILGMIETLKSTEKTIEIAVNLSSLGFGNNARVNLVLDASTSEENASKVLGIDIEHAMIGELELNATISTRKFNAQSLSRIDDSRDTFDELNFVPGTFAQVEEILDTKQAAFELSGSAFGEDDLGFTFDGWAQLDYGAKNGFGHIDFLEYKYSPTKAQTTHNVDISIDDFDGDHTNNNMYFEYRDQLRGRFTLKTFDDIIDVVMKLIESPDTRFTKFLQPILDKIFGSVLVQAIQEQDYLALSQSSLLKSVKQVNGGNSVEIVLSKELLMDLLPSDLVLRINLKTNDKNEKCLDSIDIVDLNALNKTINVTIKLGEYIAQKANPVDLTKTFLDFSDIAVLLEFGINTTELNYFHLTANVDLKVGGNLLKIPLGAIKLDFHVYVNGTVTKVYGKMAESPVPLKSGVSEFVFEPANTEDDLIGGKFYIRRTEEHLLLSDEEFYYVCDSDYFLDNILNYLLGGFIGLDSGITNAIGNLDLSSSEETDPQYENIFTSTGFQYTADEANNKFTWKTGISIEAFLCKDTIAPVEATIIGKKVDGVGYLSQVKAKTTIASLLPIDATINLVNPDPAVKDWPVSIENSYQEIVAIYDSLSASNQAKAFNNTTGYSHKI